MQVVTTQCCCQLPAITKVLSLPPALLLSDSGLQPGAVTPRQGLRCVATTQDAQQLQVLPLLPSPGKGEMLSPLN